MCASLSGRLPEVSVSGRVVWKWGPLPAARGSYEACDVGRPWWTFLKGSRPVDARLSSWHGGYSIHSGGGEPSEWACSSPAAAVGE
jgi:hypothetical protein